MGWYSRALEGRGVIRSAAEYDRFRAALVPVDQAFFDSEQKWGVGRLERLVGAATLASWRRGWAAWREVLEGSDPDGAERVGPMMIAALRVMDREAAAAGALPLAPDCWECGLADGSVLVVVRTAAEASAVLRAATPRHSIFTAGAQGGVQAAPAPQASIDEALPPDLSVTVRDRHDGRALEVWTMAEVARLVEAHGSVVGDRRLRLWEGTEARSGRAMEELAAHDLVRTGYPLPAPIGADVVLPF